LRQAISGLQGNIAWEGADSLPLRLALFWPFFPQKLLKTRFLAVLLAAALKRLARHK
jgi:hypothetical protein